MARGETVRYEVETIEMERNQRSYGSRIAPFSGRTKKRRAGATSAAPGFSDKRGPLFAEHLPLREQVDIQQNRTSLFRFYFRQQFLRDVFLSSEDQLYRLYANASRGVSGWVATTIRHFLRVAA